MATAEQILDRAIVIGNEKSTAAEELLDQAVTASLGYSFVTAPTLDATPAVVEPNVFIPTTASGVDQGLFNTTYQTIIDDLSTMYADFLTAYFPVGAGLMNAVEAWLQQAVAGGTGVNPAVEQQMWQRERDRLTAAKNEAQAGVLASWAAKGFPLPPGAAAGAINALEVRHLQAVGDQARAVAIKAFETEIENVRFAIKQAVDYRSQAVQAAGDYIRALALGPQLATQIATASADAQSRLISSASSYYNARINVAQLAQQRNITQAELGMRAALDATDKAQARNELGVNAAVAAAQSLGQQAAAALNAVNATAQLIESVA